MMKRSLFLLVTFPLILYLSITPISQSKERDVSENPLKESVKDDKASTSQSGSRAETDKAIEEYEREKLNRLKRNIGQKFMAIRTERPAEFLESPEDLGRKIQLKDKEGFIIVDVVQNRLETMYFYKVRFDSGKIGYLSADGYYLDIKIREGKIIPVHLKRTSKKPSQKMKSLHTVDMSSEAIEMVKNHLTRTDPITGERKTVERRMLDAKASLIRNLQWRYEAKEIGDYKYRVTQYVKGGPEGQTVRTWIVDLFTVKVTPENPAAKQLY